PSLAAAVVEANQRSSMPPRVAPRAYRSAGCSRSRRPGIRNDRGTQVGARRRMPLAEPSTCLISCGLAVSAAAAGLVFLTLSGAGRFVFFLGGAAGFLAMPIDSSKGAGAGLCRVLIGPDA